MYTLKNLNLDKRVAPWHLFYLLSDPGAMLTLQISQEEGSILIVNLSMHLRNLQKTNSVA